jgi:drug/metabolite transporter (DMT)-like permease
MVEIIGLFFALFTIFVWALASLVYKKGLEKTRPKANIFFRLCCTSLGTFIFALIFGNFNLIGNLSSQQLIDYLVACLVSGLSVTIGDLLYYMSLSRIDASRTYPLVQLSLIFVIFYSIIFLGEQISISIIIGGSLILSSVFLISTRDKSEKINEKRSLKEKISEDLILGILFAICTAFFWALAYVSFFQASTISGDVFSANFFRVVFQREYYAGFKKENRTYLKYFIYIGIAGILSLGFADALYIKAAEISELILISTFTVNTPMVQQVFSILILKEKFRVRFIVAVVLIIVGNYIILFF